MHTDTSEVMGLASLRTTVTQRDRDEICFFEGLKGTYLFLVAVFLLAVLEAP